MMPSKTTSIPAHCRTIQQLYRRQMYFRRSSHTHANSSSSASVAVYAQRHQYPIDIHLCNDRTISFSTATDSAAKDAITTEAIDDSDNNRSKILSLYRSIRRLHHTSLPSNLRDVGNKYLQSEFRTLKDTTKMTSKNFQNFMIEWEKYRQQLLQSQKELKFGQPLPSDVQLTSEQQEQLRKLHQEVTNPDSNNKLK